MKDKDAIYSFLSPPYGDEVQFYSSLWQGLLDCRAATNRSAETGQKLPDMIHDSMVGALGYLVLVDLIGTCLTRKDFVPSRIGEGQPFVHALEAFCRDLSSDQISTLYALRCALAHDFSLYNVHPTKPELTFFFQLISNADAPLIQPAKSRWSGVYAERSSDNVTCVGITKVGDLVEEIYNTLKSLAENDDLVIRLDGGETKCTYAMR